jgi:hypothetical protein
VPLGNDGSIIPRAAMREARRLIQGGRPNRGFDSYLPIHLPKKVNPQNAARETFSVATARILRSIVSCHFEPRHCEHAATALMIYKHLEVRGVPVTARRQQPDFRRNDKPQSISSCVASGLC